MTDPGKGRGRGLALLQTLKTQMMGSSPETSPETTPGPSIAPSVVSSTSGVTSVGGRGRLAAMLLANKKPGGLSYSPASDVNPAPVVAPPKGAGRGIKILQKLHAQLTKPEERLPPTAVQHVTQKMAESTLGSTVSTVKSSVAKNKAFSEVKETAPVVMKGTFGTPCEVTANFVYLNFEENNVFEYEVKYEPDQDHKSMRFKLLNEHRQYFTTKTFDGTTLYVPHQLPDEATSLVSINEFDKSEVNISIIFRRTRRLSEMVHIYNVLFKQIMKDLQLVRFGRQHFNEHAAIQIPQHKLEVWPGYVTAVDEYEGGLMLTLDSTHRVLRTQSVLSVVKECVQTQGTNWKKAIVEMLVGCSVMTTYNKKLFRIAKYRVLSLSAVVNAMVGSEDAWRAVGSFCDIVMSQKEAAEWEREDDVNSLPIRRRFMVDSVDDTMTPKSTFEKNEKGQIIKISYIDYYKKNYGIDIMDWDQPMLISRDTKRLPGSEAPTDFMICLVPELCQMTGLTDDQRNNFRLMKDVATYTRITPNQRHAAFKKYIQNVLENESARKRLQGWGLSIAADTINITARTLPPERLFFGRDVAVDGKPNADWGGDATRNAVMQAVDILRWGILFTDRDKQVAKDFLDTLKRCCGPMGIVVNMPDMVRLPNDRTDSYIQALKKCITPQLQLVVAICPTARDDRYAAIKRICCAEIPVPSQVINARTLGNQAKIRSITQKILLQINCKLGGTLWHISIPCKTAMVVGIDSYHDPSRKKRSVVSFIASYNQTMSHWYSRAVFQERGQEIVDCLKSCLVDSLKHYLKTNGRLPDRIIIYRDGVGDGQFNLIKDYEIPQMKVCFTLMGTLYKPKLTYVVVQKRINTRIFLKAGRELANPNPGTVLDHMVTRRDWYDFLIVSQKVTQGTVTPTHYVVIYDDSDMTPDHCQRITYKMCHLYYNWPGTVRVPAPCQYAHKLSYLIGQNVNQQPAEVLSDKLFFL